MSNVRALSSVNSSSVAFLAGGGETGAGLRAVDWVNHPLGPPEQWPQSLKTIVRVMLDSRYAMWMAWGPRLTFFCNDAYLPTVGLKREWVLGARSDEVWKEIWPDIGPRIEHVLSSGQATWDEGLLLFLERSGFTEETYHTFSYSPVYDDSSLVAGMLCVVTEVTERVIGERRLHVLRDLASQAAGADDVASSCRRAMEVLARYPLDLTFGVLYTIDVDGREAHRAALTANLPVEHFPETLTWPPEPGADRWELGALHDSGQRQTLSDLSKTSFTQWPGQTRRAVVLPLAGADRLLGFLLAGVSPRRPFDDAYSSFLDLIAGQVSVSMANAQAYEAERERAEALAAIDRAKTAFFSNVSHEFRTPLTLMLGPIEDMVTDSSLPAAARGRLDLLHRNSLRLLKLVNSLLEFSRIEAGRVQATYVPTDLTALTADLVSTFESALELAGLTLKVDLQPLSEPVYVDRDMWEKVVLNLLSNAFKYTLQGTIEVRLARGDGHAVLSVRDSGIGIPPDAIPRLFERFYRVEGAQGRTHEGSGIGLALVNELVKLHGGSASVESEINKGTTLTVLIPLGKAHLPAEHVGATDSLHAAVAAARPYVEEAMRWLPETATSLADTPTLAMKMTRVPTPRDAHPRAAIHGSRVIVADDNSDMRAYVRELLESRYEVEVVPDGQAALEAARRAMPDLMVSDVMMPRMDGFALLRTLRADPQLRDVPTILLSARAGEEAVIEGLDAMADDYLVKPFSARELIARVGAQLQLARLRREAAARERELLNSAPLGIYLIGADFRIQDVNPTARPLFGALENLIGRDFDEVMHEGWPTARADEVVRLFRHTLQTGEPFETRAQIAPPHHSGEVRHYDWQIHRVPLPDGRFGVVCYFTDVTSHVEARTSLENADRQKNEFLAMLAHELRNPLAPLRNAGEILARTLPPEASRGHAVVAMLKRQVSQLTRLVDDLLDVSRITRGRVELQRRPIELSSVISQAMETAEPLFQGRQHDVSIISSYRSLYVDGDVTRLVQCVVNILTNAAKYTEAGGKIRVETRAEDSDVVVTVTDSGAGIAPELLPSIFDLFVQGERTLDRSLGGLGIGLSVAKRLIEMHGGTLTATSPGLGQGATFEIRLPRLERPQEGSGNGEAPNVVPRRILIVDDNADAANSLAVVLGLDGHATETVYSATDALTHAAVFHPDVILLDIGLPEMDGYEVARRLRAHPDFSKVRIVALTGYGQSDDIRRSREAGFDGHLTKPVDFGALASTLAG